MIVSPRKVQLTTRTEVDVLRSLPNAELRRIGAWVFLDHFGPTKQVEGMVVAAHPHTGLQTVTWLFEGVGDHRDSIGTAQVIKPGQLNLMTAGNGIAHSEKSLRGGDFLHAVQLWLALPDSVRNSAPSFQHISDIPVWESGGATAKVFIGELAGVRSAAEVHSEVVGAELRLQGLASIPVNPEWEHGILVAAGETTINGASVSQGELWFNESGLESIAIESEDSLLVLIGGKPFDEPIVMWWNFIGRSDSEVRRMREEWESGIYPVFSDDIGGRIPAPKMPSINLIPR